MAIVTEIESLFETYKMAVYQKDLEAFTAIFDEKVRVYDIWQQWTYDGLAAWREMAKGWFSSLEANRDVVTFDDIQIQATGEMAVASAIIRFTNVSEKGEELRYLENRLTWVARKSDQGWKIIHEHTSSPIDFSTMKVILQR
ncbi:YybH family protein [Puia dinghuensis]|uniref:Ketosteroid isomerase n=1 Tax=Puia dinghuensis TaxID=1792502 RepID=A0A8J2UFF0_9BACT|nr:SgcJ/EcaC family oxidoreductase [Puia dinghuensis]GGB10564.1 ketosteroid isomerase [Puia dinghuensis]